LCNLDTPIQHVVAITHEYRKNGYEIWLMTGRAESCKDKTIQSMKDHGVEYDFLKMRSKDVFIPDYVLKPAWISKYIGKERVEVIYDDTDNVIEGFRKKGLNVIDVKEIDMTNSVFKRMK
jgi:acid phosphatase class B